MRQRQPGLQPQETLPPRTHASADPSADEDFQFSGAYVLLACCKLDGLMSCDVQLSGAAVANSLVGGGYGCAAGH